MTDQIQCTQTNYEPYEMSVVVEDGKTSWDGKFEGLAFIFLELKELNYQCSKFLPTSIETTAVSQCYVIVNS